MTTIETGLLATTLLLALAILAVLWRINAKLNADDGLDDAELSSALNDAWRDLEFDEAIYEIKSHAGELRDVHNDISQLMRAPRERGEFGEQQLDIILGDHLPTTMYGLRDQVVDGKTPDAHIESTAGTICIDSKFPLDNYERAIAATDDAERAKYERAFRNDVDRQLDKIANDYVQPSKGTTDFAFAFIPSESVYYHLVTEEHDLVREYTKRGVQVVSPLTLGHKLELVKADIHAKQLSNQAEQIQQTLQELAANFNAVEEDWETLYGHIRNVKNKADDVDANYERLTDQFNRIDHIKVDADD